MNENIEDCGTYEEDDDILLSLWVKVFLLDRFRSMLSILVLSVQMIIIYFHVKVICLCFQTLLDRFRLLVLLSQLKGLFGILFGQNQCLFICCHKTGFTIITILNNHYGAYDLWLNVANILSSFTIDSNHDKALILLVYHSSGCQWLRWSHVGYRFIVIQRSWTKSNVNEPKDIQKENKDIQRSCFF